MCVYVFCFFLLVLDTRRNAQKDTGAETEGKHENINAGRIVLLFTYAFC